MRPARHRSLAGHTLVEISISMVLAVIVTAALAGIIDVSLASHRAIAIGDRAVRAQQSVLGDIREDALIAIRVHGNDAVGASLLAALDTTTAPPAEGTRLPALTSGVGLAPDISGLTDAGNALLFVAEARPLSESPAGTPHRIDVVRVIAYYTTFVDEKVLADSNERIDVIRFVSRPYVLQTSVEAIRDDVERAAVLAALLDAGYDVLMTLDQSADLAFHRIASPGVIEANAIVAPVIEPAIVFPMRGLLSGSPVSVAANDPPRGVPRYAQLDPDAPEFPGGFEVKLSGPFAATRVLVRLRLVAGGARALDVAMDVTKVLTVGAR